MGAELFLWAAFAVTVVVLLYLDLAVFHKHAHQIQFREAVLWTICWVLLALAFNAAVYIWLGSEKGTEFLTAYIVEKSLSIDNIFIFAVIFTYFGIPLSQQHRVLFWGIIGAVLMRAIIIVTGVSILDAVHWMIYVFGAFLIFTGLKLGLQKHMQFDPKKNLAVRLVKRLMPITSEPHENRFFIRRDGRLFATTLFLALVVIEATDLFFAIDSVPAVLSISSDIFIIYTSNIFAILGLRALYFVVINGLAGLRYLKVGLSVVLVFVGLKMAGSDIYHTPPLLSLAIILGVLSVAIAASVIKTTKEVKTEMQETSKR